MSGLQAASLKGIPCFSVIWAKGFIDWLLTIITETHIHSKKMKEWARGLRPSQGSCDHDHPYTSNKG